MRPAYALMLLLLPANAPVAMVQTPPTAATASQDAALLTFLDAAYDAQLRLSPEGQTQLGLKTDQDRLDDYTDAAARRERALAERQLAEMRARFRPEQLGESARVSYRLFEYEVERGRASFPFRTLRFPVSTNGSPAGAIPVLLINNHKVDTVADARAYIARLRDTERVMREVVARMRAQAAKGIVPPQMVFAPARNDAKKILVGAPFTAGPDSTVMADFAKKVAALDAPPATKEKLLADARNALTGPFKTGYDTLFAALEAGDRESLAPGFVLSAAVLRHFVADPLLPRELLPRDWPGAALRRDYDRYDALFRRRLREWSGRPGD